jgi:hypothetical protein
MSGTKGKVARDAGYVGGGTFARQVRSNIKDALSRAQKESQGADRTMASKIDYKIDENKIRITYKVEKRNISEQFPFGIWDDVKDLVEAPTTVLDLATNDPQVYWLWKYHTDDIEEELRERNLLQEKRHRRR